MSTKSKKDDIHLNGRACLELELHSPESVPLPPASSSQGQSPCPSTSSEPPDGGSKAWLAVFGAWCCLFCSFGWVNCIGLFQAQYEKHQLSSYTHSTVAWITSVEVRLLSFFFPARFPFFPLLFWLTPCAPPSPPGEAITRNSYVKSGVLPTANCPANARALRLIDQLHVPVHASERQAI